MPPDLEGAIKESCFDCHSHQVRLPWYTRLAPLSWWVADEVRRGRAGVNFSTWSDYSPRRRALAWRRSLQRIREHAMPPLTYRLLHPTAINEEQLQSLETFLKAQELAATAGLSADELLAWPAPPLVESQTPLRGAFRLKGGVLQRPLLLDQALILVDGDLVSAAGVQGTGAILATGKLELAGLSGEVGPLALVGQQGISLEGRTDCRLKGWLLSSGAVSHTGLELQRQSSFSIYVPGIREDRFEFCRDDGQLGERIERQVVVRHGNGQFVIWDPEFQTVRSARSVEAALVEVEKTLLADPATSVIRWRRHFRKAWRSRLEELARHGSPARLHLLSTPGLTRE